MLRMDQQGPIGPRLEAARDNAFSTRGLALHLPSGERIAEVPDFSLAPGEQLVVDGPSGAGKSSLFRALAGIWPFGEGRIERPEQARMLFLPQRAYLPVATLREAATYPSAAGTFSDAEVREVLRAVGLEGLGERLDEVQNWSLLLSGGEQQRVAIARALLQRPDWLFLDEATAALDEPSEARMYELLRERLPGAAIVSIAHRPGVAPYHQTRLSLAADGSLAELVPS